MVAQTLENKKVSGTESCIRYLTPLLPLGTTVQMVRSAFVKSGTA